MIMRIGLRGRILLFFLALAFGSVAALAIGLWFGYHRQGNPDMFNAFVQGALVAGFAIVGLIAAIAFLFDTHLARPMEQLAAALRVRTHGDVASDIDATPARYLGDLGEAAVSLSSSLARHRDSLAETVARETARLAAVKTKLEHLLCDVPPAVLLCTGRHHIVFYNSAAQAMLSAPKTPVCLGRNLFDYVSDGAIRRGHQRLVEAGPGDAVFEFVCASPCGSRRLAGRMRLARDNGGDAAAYVVTLRDVTGEIAAYARRDALLSEVFEVLRPRVSALAARVASEVERDASSAIAQWRGDVVTLDESLAALAVRFEACRADGWPLAAIDVRELAVNIERRLASYDIVLEVETSPLAVRCNAVDIVLMLAQLAQEVACLTATRRFRLTVREKGDVAEIWLGWQGQALPAPALESWLERSLDGSAGGLTAKTILGGHASALVAEEGAGLAFLGLSLPRVQPVAPSPDAPYPAVVYDFDLLSRADAERMADAALDDLAFVVFDTETTGLFPERGDEIVQIAAVRIVNGKLVPGERLDMLVHPGRAIPRASSAIHGVTDDMVADAPSVQEAVERFHAFALDAVIVAHNAPFDMAFLWRREAELGLHFANPILDTVLLSAAIFGLSENHTLDDLAHRLGVSVSPSERHTAMGDTLATAEVFLRMKRVLQARGITRLGDLLAETRRYDKLLQDANRKA